MNAAFTLHEERRLRALIREMIVELIREGEKKPKHKGKTSKDERERAKKTLRSLEKRAKTWKGKLKYMKWADDPDAALGALYAKAGKDPRKD